MRSEATRLKVGQLNLFHPPQVSIRWETLPREIQQQSVHLLARLLRDHCARSLAHPEGQEFGDE